MIYDTMRLILCFLFIIPAAITKAQFTDQSAKYGINNIGSNYGVSFGDYDNDGDDDLYITTRGQEANLFYENNSGQFIEVSQSSNVVFTGSSNGAVWFDYNNDGYLDLYVGNERSQNILYKNSGDKTFIDVTGESNTGDTRNPLALMAGDLNGDGHTDLYLANISTQNSYYQNNGDGTFKNVILQSGAVDDLIAMGSILFDYDNDNDLDIYLTHDAKQPNILYQNDGNGNFTDVSAESKADTRCFCMGVDIADFNRDGYQDIYIANLEYNTLLTNNGDGTFDNLSVESGTDDFGMGWGTTTFDYDHDGFEDIYVVNNYFFSPFVNILYNNLGDFYFEADNNSTVLESKYAGFGIAYTDLQSDGDLDLVIANSGQNSVGNQLFINESNDGNWVSFKLIGKNFNKDAIGSKLKLVADGDKQYAQLVAGSGYLSQNSMWLHFGLANSDEIDSLVITWPNGTIEVHSGLEVNQHYYVMEEEQPTTNLILKPLKPSNLKASFRDHFVRLQWSDNSFRESGFQIFRSVGDSSNLNPFGKVSGDVTEFVDNDIRPNQQYFYSVQSYNDFGASPYSNIAEVIFTVTSAENDLIDGLITHPNPTKGRFKIQSREKLDFLSIYNLNGEKLSIQQNGDFIDLSGYPAGIYILDISVENNSIQKKILKK